MSRNNFHNHLIIFISLIIILTSFIPFNALYADRGIIPDKPIDVHEPGQIAIISWYGGREVLFLSSVLRVNSSDEVRIIEVLPLPSIPEIALGDKSVFENLNKLLASVSSIPRGGYLGAPGSGEGSSIIFNKVIGPHNVTVLRVNSSDSFNYMINQIFAQNNYNSSGVHVDNYIIDSYIKHGFNYFTIDIVTIHPREGIVMVEPIIYKFNSPKLYYPMKISRLNKGMFTAKLFIITSCRIPPGALDNLNYRDMYYDSRAFWKWELARIDNRLVEVFPFWITCVHVNYFEIQGDYNYLGDDDIYFEPVYSYDTVQVIIVLAICIAYAFLLFKRTNLNFIKKHAKSVLFYSILVFGPLLLYWSMIPYVYANRLFPSLAEYGKWLPHDKYVAVIRNTFLLLKLIDSYFPILSVIGLLFLDSWLDYKAGSPEKTSFWKIPGVYSNIIVAIYTYFLLILMTRVQMMMWGWFDELMFTITANIIVLLLVLALFALTLSIPNTRSKKKYPADFWQKPLPLAITLLAIYIYPTLTYSALFFLFSFTYVYITVLSGITIITIPLILALFLVALRYIYEMRE